MNIRRVREKICCLQDQVVSLGLDPQVGLPPAGSSLNAYQRRVCCLEQLANLDEDALDWILRVEEQDTQPLENAVRLSMNRLVVSAKTRGVWDEDAQLTIASGARTLDGALVPLLGSALTNFNFVSGDYTRKGGLEGDGATKYLGGVAGNAYPQNDYSAFVYLTDAPNSLPETQYYLSTGTSQNGTISIFHGGTGSISGRVKTSSAITSMESLSVFPSLLGNSRQSSTSATIRHSRKNFTQTINSNGNKEDNILYYRSITMHYISAQFSAFLYGYWSDLEIWDQILTQYHADLATAIP